MAHRILEHKCFDELAEQTGSNATFEKMMGVDIKNGKMSHQWVMNLWTYTASQRVSQKRPQHLIPNFCPICGQDFQEN